MVDEKISIAEKAVQASQESRDNETKSSAGDKHETGRAMVQIEQEQNSLQLSKALDLKKTLNTISEEPKGDKVQLGSFIKASNGYYFISIGVGKVTVNNEIVFAISAASPVGQLLLNKKVNDTFKIANKEITIQEIC